MRAQRRYEEWKARQMQDPEFRAAKEALEPAYQVARLRIRQGLTQEELAKLAGTTQSSIARLESGKSEPQLSFLRRVVEAMGGQLEMRIVVPRAVSVEVPLVEEVEILAQGAAVSFQNWLIGEPGTAVAPTRSPVDWNSLEAGTCNWEAVPA